MNDRRTLLKMMALGLAAVPLAGCESLDMDVFGRKEPPVPGVRRDVLPAGAARREDGLPMPADVSLTRGAPRMNEDGAPAPGRRRKRR